MRVIIIRTSGAREEHTIGRGDYHGGWINRAIGAVGTDTINLFKNPTNKYSLQMRTPVMIIDDAGYKSEARHIEGARFELVPIEALKPVNADATLLYHSICKMGTTHEIVGDVAIIDDEDLA